MKSTSQIIKVLLLGVLPLLLLAIVPVNYTIAQCIPPPTGPVSWWPGDGNANDIINGNDGTLQNGATFAPGKVGQAFSFDGVDDFVDIGKPPSLAFDNDDAFSIEAWINIDDTTTQKTIFAKSLTAGSPFTGYVFKVNNNVLTVLLQSDTFNDIDFNGGTTLIPGRWYHVALTYDGSSTLAGTKIYLDGVEESKTTISDVIPPLGSLLNIGNAVIGARVSNTNAIEHMHGRIDEVEVYSRVLTSAEILAIFNAGSAGKCKDTETPQEPPVAVAGTSLDGDDLLQLDGTLSSDSGDDPLTFSWQIDGEATPRLGQIVSIADLAVGNYLVTLTVSDGIDSTIDTMLFGVPAGSGVVGPTPDVLQEITLAIQDLIISFQTSNFYAPNDKARENRRKALLNMLDKVFDAIGIGDFQAAIDQLRDVLAKSDGLGPPDSAPDWIIGTDAQAVFQAAFNLVDDLLFFCGECQ